MKFKYLYNDSLRELIGRVSKIRKDSIFISKVGLSFTNIIEIKPIKGNTSIKHYYYERRDSLNYVICIPSDSIYNSRRNYTSYIHSIENKFEQIKSERVIPPDLKNLIKINIPALLNLELAFSWEYRFAKKWSFEIEPGYQIASKSFETGYNTIYPQLHCYEGFSVTMGPKYFSLGKSYIQPIFIYKYLVMENKWSYWPESYCLQDQFVNQYGGALRLGRIYRIKKAVVELFCGLGYKKAVVHQLAYQYYQYRDDQNIVFYYNSNHSPRVRNYNKDLLVINAGIKFGFGF